MEFEKRYTTDEAAEILGLAKQTIYKLIQRGTLQAIKIGRCKYITASELERVLTYGTNAVTTQAAKTPKN